MIKKGIREFKVRFFIFAFLFIVLPFTLWAETRPIFNFIVLADPHLSEVNNNALQKFETAVEQINGLKPDFVLIVGDIKLPQANTDEESKAKELFSGFKMPAHIVFGNNDSSRDRLREFFPEVKKNDYYSFKYKNSVFIGLCDSIPGDHIGHLESEHITPGQLEWLEKELADNHRKADHIFLFAHIPISPTGKSGRMFLAQNDQVYIFGLIKKYKPTALFFGHLHNKLEFEINRTKVIVVPSSCWNTLNFPLGFLRVEVFKNKIKTEYILLKT